MTDFVDWNVKRDNQERVCCPVGFSEDVIAVFKMKNISEKQRSRQKTQNFQTFKVFMHFLSKFRQTSRIEMFETVIKLGIRCPEGFYEEIIAVFEMKVFLKLALK